MKSKFFFFEVLLGAESEVFILRDGRGKIVHSSVNAGDFLSYVRSDADVQDVVNSEIKDGHDAQD